jgi:hypothetical protein
MTSHNYPSLLQNDLRVGDGYAQEATAHQQLLLDPFGVERPPNMMRKVAEALLYIPVLTGVFLDYLGIIQIRYAAGSINLFCGLAGLAIVLMHRERLPLSVWFGLIINVGANATQVLANDELPVLGKGLPFLLFHLGNLLLTCFVIQNSAAMKRVILFYVMLLFLLTAVSGSYMETHKTERLAFEGIGGGLGNPNTIAYMSATFSISLLFWSLRASKSIRPILWTLAICIFIVLLRTVSRTGLVMFFAGFFLLILAIVGGKGTRIGGLILLGFCMLVLSQIAYLVADQIMYFERRMELKTAEGRLGIYTWSTVQDLMETLLFGRGPDRAQVGSTGIAAHNSFIYIHQAYGGIAAWPYLTWLIMLGVRTFRMVISRDYPLDIRLWIISLLGMAIGGELTNNINMTCYSSLFAWAMIEKYAVGPYSKKAIAQRQYESYLSSYHGQFQHAPAS